MERDFLIAEHRIRVRGERLLHAVEAMPGFSAFKTETAGEPICWFKAAATQTPEIEKTLYRNENKGIVSYLGRYANGYVFEMIPQGIESLKLWIEKDTRVAYFDGNLDAHLLRFACWIAYGVITIPQSTVAVHTSTILYKNKAVCFLGESGTGKSTHTRLWQENIEGAELLNDDSPILRLIDGKSWVYGSPWSGKTPCYKNEHYPLAACVRLSQALDNSIKKLNVVQGYGALHPSCPPCFAYDDGLYDHISETLSNLLTEVPVYHLACLPNAEAVRLSCETIFGICEK